MSEPQSFDRNDVPSVGETYRTNKGTGRDEARVVRVSDAVVELQLLRCRQRRRARFTLPLVFFQHRVCGWRRTG
jgi:hypothetical protein